MEDIKNFAGGGLDQDSGIEFLSKNDYINAFNIRLTGSASGEAGLITNIESNQLIAGDRATGLNKAIGAAGFQRTRKGYSFIYNSQGYHQIIEIDFDSETQTVIFTNKTDSGGEDILPLNPKCYVNDIKLINGNFLSFTDDNMQPCYISLERLKNGSLGVLTEDDFRLIKAQPMVLPSAVYNNDSKRSVNLLRQNLFQPIVQFVYLDDEYSAWSSMGKRPVPETENTPAIGTNVSIANNLIFSIDVGNTRVKTINVGTRIGMADFCLIKTIDRSDVLALPNTAVDVSQEIYEAYDPVTNLYSFAFYNDGLYTNIDVLETDLAYDHVPLKVGTEEVINGSILALADITEGYERPAIDVTINSTSYDPQISFELPPDGNSLKQSPVWGQYRPKHKSYRRVTIPFSGIPKTGDVISIYTGSLEGAAYNTITHTVSVAEDEDLLATVQALASKMPYPSNIQQSGSGYTLNFSTRREDETPDGGREECKNVKISLANAGTGQSKSILALKTNSSYQLALACKDKYGRYFPIATDSRYVVKTPSFSQLLGLTPSINWTINNATAPEGAAVYQWLLSVNNTHQSTLWVNAILDSTSTNSDYFVFKINSLLKFNNNNSSSILNYDHVPGDRCTFVYELTDGVKTWFDKIDVEVSGFEIKIDESTDPDTTNYLLKVNKPASITQSSIAGKNILLEVYTPRKRATISGGNTTYSETLYFEIGEQFDIINGEFSRLSGSITQGDIYLKTRVLANALDPNTVDVYVVEDFNFSDFYESNYNSYGRPRTYDDIRGQVRRMASIRYSDTFLEGTRINGITRFFAERIYGDNPGETSSNYGSINKIRQVDNYLVCLQETKPGSIPVNISIIEDQTARENIAISDRLFNYIRYSNSGSFGMGGCKESFAERPDGTIYYVDPNNSLPMRFGKDGTRPIPGNMSKYFRRTLQAAKEAGLKIIGYYDVFNDEYIVAIEQLGDVISYFPFDATNWRFIENYSISPGNISITTPPTKGIATYDNVTGIVKYVSNAGVSGSDFFIQSFSIDGVVTTKKTCITIIPGETTPYEFVFVDLLAQELSTLVESNAVLVAGINVPVAISITGGQYQITRDGVALGWTGVSGFVESDDVVTVRHTTSASYETTTNTVLTVSTVSDTFSSTTKADITPDAFAFVDVTDADLSTAYESNTVTITGISSSIDVSITGGEYSKNGGAYTSVAGTAVENDTFKVKQTSSASLLTATNTVFTAGTFSDTYTVTTKGYQLTIDNTSNQAPTVQVIDDTDSTSLYYTSAPANTTVGPVNITPIIDSGTYTVKVSGVDLTTENITLTIDGVSHPVDVVSGTDYYFNLVPKGAISLSITMAQTLTLPDFDYLKITYAWTGAAGSDLDTFTGFINTGTASDNDWVGFGQGDAKVPASATDPYAWWAGDNTAGGKETVLIDFKKFLLDNPSTPNPIEIRMNAVWYSGKLTGDVSVGITTYKGGTMSLDAPNFDFINTGGAVVSDTSVPVNVSPESNSGLIANSQDIATVEYNKTTLAAQLILV